MTPAPKGWVRVLIRPRHRGARLPHFVDNLGTVWNRALGSWVLEPTPEHRFIREKGAWGPVRNDTLHLRAELALRELGSEFSLEWQVDGNSALPRGREDVTPTTRTNHGWSTPKWEDPR